MAQTANYGYCDVPWTINVDCSLVVTVKGKTTRSLGTVIKVQTSGKGHIGDEYNVDLYTITLQDQNKHCLRSQQLDAKPLGSITCDGVAKILEKHLSLQAEGRALNKYIKSVHLKPGNGPAAAPAGGKGGRSRGRKQQQKGSAHVSLIDVEADEADAEADAHMTLNMNTASDVDDEGNVRDMLDDRPEDQLSRSGSESGSDGEDADEDEDDDEDGGVPGDDDEDDEDAGVHADSGSRASTISHPRSGNSNTGLNQRWSDGRCRVYVKQLSAATSQGIFKCDITTLPEVAQWAMIRHRFEAVSSPPVSTPAPITPPPAKRGGKKQERRSPVADNSKAQEAGKKTKKGHAWLCVRSSCVRVNCQVV
jgi:hypothetical protein